MTARFYFSLCGVNSCGVIDTAESDSMVSLTPRSKNYLIIFNCFISPFLKRQFHKIVAMVFKVSLQLKIVADTRFLEPCR